MIKNSLTTIGILLFAAGVCLVIDGFAEADTHVPLIFVLAVVMVSRFTDGYAYGILASMIAVVGVNYVFTYPYFEINFSLMGYPLTFVVMLGVACMVSALTTQIKNQEQIKLEVEKEKMRGNLLRAVSHDIRTPLTSIMGSASVLIENSGDISEEKKQELARDIQSEAQWLIQIVENLLSITRIDNGDGETKINKQEELLEEIVGSAVLKFKKRFPEMKVLVEMPEELVIVPMDGILIEQVLVNLLENAAIHGKYTTEILIKVLEEEVQVRVSVEDNGAGIKEPVLPRIFEGRLHSEDGAESDSKRNMGIGLSVCKTIIKAHKGNMKAENKAEGGAKFTFWLPK
ncbi:MAG: DUF4118 domain-containing protein [Lachnospiraceae bacterium]|nr:DUF4118 domain-containing protein [Lachnospiraceae bacterium]